jgi:hypothetical protein
VTAVDPQAAFALGVLVATVKGVGIAAIGAGIAWWRARRRVRELELQLDSALRAAGAADLEQLQQSVDQLAAQFHTLAEDQRLLLNRLPPGSR